MGTLVLHRGAQHGGVEWNHRSRRRFELDATILDGGVKPRLGEPAPVACKLLRRPLRPDHVTQPGGYEQLECVTTDVTRIQTGSFEIRREFRLRVSLERRRDSNRIGAAILPYSLQGTERACRPPIC